MGSTPLLLFFFGVLKLPPNALRCGWQLLAAKRYNNATAARCGIVRKLDDVDHALY
jgi:hypothetical protein